MIVRDKKILTHHLTKIINEENLISMAIVVKLAIKLLEENNAIELLDFKELPEDRCW